MYQEMIGVTNMSERDITMKEGVVTTLVDTEGDNLSLTLPGQVKVGASEDAVSAAYPAFDQLEWDGNEIHLDGQTEEEVRAILVKAIGILLYWKKVLEHQYPETQFFVFASYDHGDMLVLEEGELPTRSVTLRFWADRGTDTVINLDSFDDWEQPAIVGYCNFRPRD
jgi:hypothetical protein